MEDNEEELKKRYKRNVILFVLAIIISYLIFMMTINKGN